MNITTSLLYMLLLYAVLDRGNKLSLTNGLILGFVILLLNCYFGRYCNNATTGIGGTNNTAFTSLNGF